MKRIIKVSALSLLLFSLLFASGCSSTTKIGDILANQAKYQNKSVAIKGTISDTVWFAAVGKGAYQVGDGSGNIWVVTSQPPPQDGVLISAKGKVQSAFTILERSFGTVIMETQRQQLNDVGATD